MRHDCSESPRARNQKDKIGVEPGTRMLHNHHDWTDAESLSYTISKSIAILTGESPQVGPPLSNSIDTDALDQLFMSDDRFEYPPESLTFYHRECKVTVFRNGHIIIEQEPHR